MLVQAEEEISTCMFQVINKLYIDYIYRSKAKSEDLKCIVSAERYGLLNLTECLAITNSIKSRESNDKVPKSYKLKWYM